MDQALDVMLNKSPAERLWYWSTVLGYIAKLNSPVVVIGGAALAAHGVVV